MRLQITTQDAEETGAPREYVQPPPVGTAQADDVWVECEIPCPVELHP